jgi:hypothetical protein
MQLIEDVKVLELEKGLKGIFRVPEDVSNDILKEFIDIRGQKVWLLTDAELQALKGENPKQGLNKFGACLRYAGELRKIANGIEVLEDIEGGEEGISEGQESEAEGVVSGPLEISGVDSTHEAVSEEKPLESISEPRIIGEHENCEGCEWTKSFVGQEIGDICPIVGHDCGHKIAFPSGGQENDT